MNYKTLLTFLFVAILALSAVSALTLSSTLPANVSSTATSFPITFTLNNTNASGSTVVTFGSVVLSPIGSSVTFPSLSTTLAASASTSFTATVNLPVSKSGSVVGTIFANSSNDSPNVTLSFSVPIIGSINFCKAGQKGGNLSITDFSINTDGEDEEVWKPLDIVTIEVEVENNGNNDVDDVFVEIGLFDSAGRNQIRDMDFFNEDEEEFDIGDIKDGDEEVATFEFRVPADADADDYQLKVKAYSKKLREENECTDTSADMDQTTHQNVDIEQEDDEGKFIAFDNVEFNPSEATCGDRVTLSFDAYNIGEDDEDQVKVTVQSDDLRFDLSQEIKQGLDQGDHESMLFTFTVPQSLADKNYNVELSAEYDYRNGIYREELEEEEVYSLKVFGCSAGTGTGTGTGTGSNKATITASLDSDAEAGEDLTITATITNRQNAEASFVIGATDYSSWAELVSISDRLITLDAGESEEVTFIFDVDEDAAGEQAFTIEATSGGSTTTREVVVDVEGRTPGVTGFGDNGLIWVLGILIVVLLIAIILVAIKLSKD